LAAAGFGGAERRQLARPRGFSQTNISSRERSSAAAGLTSTSASDCAGSRRTSAMVPTG
jgi:hypothetical protein